MAKKLKFKVGDRVKVLGDALGGSLTRFRRCIGTVRNTWPDNPYQYEVLCNTVRNNLGELNIFAEAELEFYTPEYIDKWRNNLKWAKQFVL